MRVWLNKFLYMPPCWILLANAVLLAVVVILAAIYNYFSTPIKDVLLLLAKTDDSLWATVCLLLLGLVATFVSIYAKARKYFICSRQSLSAALGTTLVVTLFYTIIWSLIQLAKGNELFVLLHPSFWRLQDTLNDLKAGSMLFLFSSLSLLFTSLFVVDQDSFDFTSFRQEWLRWRSPVEKLVKNSVLSLPEHDSLVASTQSMLQKLADRRGYVQPVAEATAQQVQDALRAFDDWYTDKTRVTYADCKGLDDLIRPRAQKILELC